MNVLHAVPSDHRPSGLSLLERARQAADVASEHAAEVDAQARFPVEAMAMLRAASLMSIGVPDDFGGEGASLTDIAQVTTVLGSACASTALIYAMHQIQVACLVRHGSAQRHQDMLRRLVTGQLLLASATTETGVGGDVRTSLCAVNRSGERITLAKQTPVISYGDHADAVLVTARRTPDSPPSDQVLVLCEAAALTLEPTGEWDTLGFRGTCSRGYALSWEGSPGAVLPDAYGDISSATMLPVSHTLWAAAWLGIAEAAARSAHSYVRSQARQKPDAFSPAALRLADLAAKLQQFRSLVTEAAAKTTEAFADEDLRGSVAFAVTMNMCKVSASQLVADIVGRALSICGMAGYRNDSPYSLGRLLRDAHGAALMINNDRIIANTSHLLLASKEL